MRKFLNAFVLSLICFSCSDPETEKTPVEATFSQELLQLKDYFQIPGLSVLVQKGDEILYEDYLGFADIEQKIPMDSITTFQMASLTKMFSALIIMQLVDEGKITLDEPLENYTENMGIGDSIKIKHALSHTSQGILGKHFYYNNNRFMLLGDVIEKASGADFRENIYRRIINPLKLKHTYLLQDSLQLVQEKRKVAQPYFLGGETRAGYLVKEPQPGFIDYGYSTAAGISSTVRDLAKLSEAIDDNILITDSAKATMTDPVGPDIPYGLGVFTQKFKDEKLVWGYGQYDCYSSLFLKVPNKDLTFIIAANNNLMSDPARLIDGDVRYSLFALSFLKNFVFELNTVPLFEDLSSLKELESKLTPGNTAFYHRKLLAQSAAATFMGRYSPEESELSKKIMEAVFNHFGHYENEGDLVLLRNLYMLKLTDAMQGREEFALFDDQIISLGEMILAKDKNNPYANFYLANFYETKGQDEKSALYYGNILNAKNFSPWWYTREAQNWVDGNRN